METCLGSKSQVSGNTAAVEAVPSVSTVYTHTTCSLRRTIAPEDRRGRKRGNGTEDRGGAGGKGSWRCVYLNERN